MADKHHKDDDPRFPEHLRPEGNQPIPEKAPHGEHPGAPSASQMKGVPRRAMKEFRG